MTIETGGPAFPIPGLHNDSDFNGMTLRDYFAAKAMQGLLSSPRGAPNGADMTDDWVSKSAYIVADAMIKARAK